jgi:Spy/CpxP family protein refolding chaperone
MNTPPALARTTLLAALTLTLALPLGAAERDRDDRGDRPATHRNPPEHRPEAPPEPGFERFLNEEQRARLREAASEQREKMQKLNARAAELQQEIEESLFAEKLDEKALRKQSAELAEIQTERQLLRARAFARLRESLTPEQLERIRERMKHRRSREQFDERPMARPRPFGPRFGEDFQPPRDFGRRREEARHPDDGPDRREFRRDGPVPPRPPAPREFRGPPGGDYRPAPWPPPDYRRSREPMPPPAPRVEPRRREDTRDGREAREREDGREPRDRRGERERERNDREERRPRPPGEPD